MLLADSSRSEDPRLYGRRKFQEHQVTTSNDEQCQSVEVDWRRSIDDAVGPRLVVEGRRHLRVQPFRRNSMESSDRRDRVT
jgi:hypothetical protein